MIFFSWTIELKALVLHSFLYRVSQRKPSNYRSMYLQLIGLLWSTLYVKMWQLKSLCYVFHSWKKKSTRLSLSHFSFSWKIQKIWNDPRISEFSDCLCNFKKKVLTKIYHMGYKISLLDRNNDYMTKFQIT
jgi:hypothetical protein